MAAAGASSSLPLAVPSLAFVFRGTHPLSEVTFMLGLQVRLPFNPPSTPHIECPHARPAGLTVSSLLISPQHCLQVGSSVKPCAFALPLGRLNPSLCFGVTQSPFARVQGDCQVALLKVFSGLETCGRKCPSILRLLPSGLLGLPEVLAEGVWPRPTS